MSKKSEKRDQRKAEKLALFEASKSAILAKVVGEDVPRIADEPVVSAEPRLAPHLARAMANTPKEVKVFGGSRFGHRLTWCATKKDTEGAWSWGELRQWSNEEWEGTILPVFTSLSSLTWAEIDALTSGTQHKMHHEQPVDSLVEEAQERWKSLNLEEFETAFRVRSGNLRRGWGYIVQAHFHLVWWEKGHRIYPVG